MSELSQSNHKIVKVLLQDTTFLNDWGHMSDALDNPVRDRILMKKKLDNGNSSMYDVISWMLETWKGHQGNEATLPKLIETFEQENLQNAADLLKAFTTRNVSAGSSSNNLTNTQQIELSSPKNATSDGMEERNLVVLERLDIGPSREVVKVQNFVDKKFSAVKKISIANFLQTTKTSAASDEYFRKLMREVKVMAQLPETQNIVAYQDSWFEGPLKRKYKEWLRNPESLPISPPPTKTNRIMITEDEKNTFMYIKMELMETNLGHWLLLNPHKIGHFPTTKTIFMQILSGLAFIHRRNIIHRNLKPNNILMNIRVDEIIVKIGDFGLSREINEIDTSLTVQVSGKSFSSPEMERGDDNYDFKTDIFSVGLIVLVMLHRFNSTKDLERALDDARRGELGILDHLEGNVLLKAMLDRKPDKRPSADMALVSLQKQGNNPWLRM